MISIRTFLACMALLTFAGAAQAQEINTFAAADAGTMAKIDRMRATGDSYKQTWTPTTNTNCSDINIGSNVSPAPGDVFASNGQPQTPAVDMPPNAVVQQDPFQTNVYTGTINNLCFARP
jgi:hypothetical protein